MLRWEHEERGLLGPAVFMDLAEEGDTASDLVSGAITNALGLLQEWG